jgi:hypothetical protein
LEVHCLITGSPAIAVYSPSGHGVETVLFASLIVASRKVLGSNVPMTALLLL